MFVFNFMIALHGNCYVQSVCACVRECLCVPFHCCFYPIRKGIIEGLRA